MTTWMLNSGAETKRTGLLLYVLSRFAPPNPSLPPPMPFPPSNNQHPSLEPFPRSPIASVFSVPNKH